MKIEIGTALVNTENGVPAVAPVGLNLNNPPYSTEGFAAVFLGSKGAGKTNLGAIMAEGCHANKIPFIYCDRGSDQFGLTELGPSVVTFGNTNHPSKERRAMRDIDSFQQLNYARTVARSVLEKGYSLVLDCAPQMKHDPGGGLDGDGMHNHPLAAFTEFMRALYETGQMLRKPCMVIVDEAHFFAPQRKTYPIQKLSTDALSVLAHDSRKAALATLLLTQRNAAINKAVIFDSNVRIFGRHSYHNDFKAVREYAELEYQQLAGLHTGEAFLVSPRGTIKVNFKLRETKSLGDTPAFESQIDELPDGSDFASETRTTVESIGEGWDKV